MADAESRSKNQIPETKLAATHTGVEVWRGLSVIRGRLTISKRSCGHARRKECLELILSRYRQEVTSYRRESLRLRHSQYSVPYALP